MWKNAKNARNQSISKTNLWSCQIALLVIFSVPNNLFKCHHSAFELGNKQELKISIQNLNLTRLWASFTAPQWPQMKNCWYNIIWGIYWCVQNCRQIFDSSTQWATRAVWKRLVFGFFTGSIMGIQIPKITKSQKSGKRHHIPDNKNVRWRLIVMLCWQVQLL